MSFLTILIFSFPLLSYSIHHLTLSSSHFHSHLISSLHTSHDHSHCLLSHRIHLFMLTTFMPSLIISFASRSSPRIFIYHSSHIILIPSSFHSIILAFFTFPLIHFTMVLFAISSKLIFTHFIYHTLLFINQSSFPSYFTSITLIITHHCFSFLIASMFSIHSSHFFATHRRISTVRSISCLFGLLLLHVHLLC